VDGDRCPCHVHELHGKTCSLKTSSRLTFSSWPTINASYPSSTGHG
jgi:hypothetical protein